MQNQLQQSIDMVKEWVGNDTLYLDTALHVKFSPHHAPFAIWAFCVSPADALYVMDAGEEWHEVSAASGSDDLVIASIYQRLMWMGRRYSKAS